MSHHARYTISARGDFGALHSKEGRSRAVRLRPGLESREAIARAVGESYGCEQARTDADAFLLSMVKEGFVLEE